MNGDTMESTGNDVPESLHLPTVITNFSGYTPPFEVAPIVERMLASVPPKYLIGLKEVVLTNSTGLSRKLRRSVTKARKRKVRIVQTLGLYHQAWHGKPAWIQIFVDNTLKASDKRFWWRIPLLRETQLGGVLFHEIGHHIHYTAHPEYREKEDVADIWKARLASNYSRQRFPLLRICFRFLSFITGPFYKTWRVNLLNKQLQKGWISRAEFDERMSRTRTAK